MSLILDEHREYLSDKIRLEAFRRAIRKTVKPGDTVLDLGCGTGILGLFACQAGASRVYAIDGGGMLQVAREIAEANGFADRIVHIREISTRAELPERVDVVIADQIGRFGFEAGVLQYFRDAAARLLKPGGRAVPRRIELWCAPVSYPRGWSDVNFWGSRPAGFEFDPALRIARNTGYPTVFHQRNLLGEPARLIKLDALGAPMKFVARAASRATKSGVMHGIAGWFRAELAPGVWMTNSSFSKGRINRRNVFFPIERPARIVSGDVVRTTFNVKADQLLATWKVAVANRLGKVKSESLNSTVRGMLIVPEDLHKTRPEFVPVLNKWGEARRTVVELCDGVRSIGDIEAGLRMRHPSMFRESGAAAAFVAEVMGPYAMPAENHNSARF